MVNNRDELLQLSLNFDLQDTLGSFEESLDLKHLQ